MNIAIIAFTARGGVLGQRIANGLEGASLQVPLRLAKTLGAEPAPQLSRWVEGHWNDADGLLFVGATGIAVRAIAPYVKDKFTDPAVVCVDELGRFVIPLLSGHVGGGNELAQQVAAIVNGQAIISTATDINHVFAVDVWARDCNFIIGARTIAKEVSAALLEGRQVGFASDCDCPCPDGLTEDITAPLGVWVSVKKTGSPFERTLPLIPKSLSLGIGCRRGTAQETIQMVVDEALQDYHFSAVTQVASIDLKGDEEGLLAFCETHNLPFFTYSAQELWLVAGEFTTSSFVASVTGVDNVCERAALREGGRLIVPKLAKNGVTVAVAERI